MRDRREEILARLYVVAQEAEGVKSWVWNRGELPNDKRPGIIVFDGDELAKEGDIGRGRPSNAPNMVTATPEVYFILDDKKPANLTVGTELNTFRRKFIHSVLYDAALQGIVGTSGSMRYDGLVTDLARGRQMVGELGMSFSFTYPLIPSELT